MKKKRPVEHSTTLIRRTQLRQFIKSCGRRMGYGAQEVIELRLRELIASLCGATKNTILTPFDCQQRDMLLAEAPPTGYSMEIFYKKKPCPESGQATQKDGNHA